MWSGHFNFLFYLFLFCSFCFLSCFSFSTDRRVLLLRTLLPQVLTYMYLLLREYRRREMFDSDELSSRLRWEMVPSCTRYIPMHEF